LHQVLKGRVKNRTVNHINANKVKSTKLTFRTTVPLFKYNSNEDMPYKFNGKGMSWTEAKTGFDALETKQHISARARSLYKAPSLTNLKSFMKSFHWYTEGNPTRYAEKLGFDIGYKTKEARSTRLNILKSFSYGASRFQY
jgi:hypothetical protein